MTGVLPHNEEAEKTILGAVLVDSSSLPSVLEQLKADDFYREGHRKIFAAMERLAGADQPIDLVTLKNELGDTLQGVGGPAYLASLLDGVPRITDVSHWAGIVRERAARRAFIRITETSTRDAYESAISTDEILDQHSLRLQRLAERRDTNYSKHISAVVREANAALESFVNSGTGVTGVPSGLADLDRLTGGFQPGTLILVAARPARGKTVLVMQIAVAAATAGFKGICFSLEMPPDAVVQRAMLADAEVDKWDDLKFAPKPMAEKAWNKILASGGRLSGLPLWFDARESPTLTQLRAHCLKYKATTGLDFVVVDYLQRIPIDGKVDRHIAIGDIAQGLKSLSRALKVPIIVASQLNREAEETEPTLSHLGESDRLAKEADIVLMLHPDDIKAWETQDFPNVMLLVRKHRAGPQDRLMLSFEKKYARFVPLGQASNWKGEL